MKVSGSVARPCSRRRSNEGNEEEVAENTEKKYYNSLSFRGGGSLPKGTQRPSHGTLQPTCRIPSFTKSPPYVSSSWNKNFLPFSSPFDSKKKKSLCYLKGVKKAHSIDSSNLFFDSRGKKTLNVTTNSKQGSLVNPSKFNLKQPAKHYDHSKQACSK